MYRRKPTDLYDIRTVHNILQINNIRELTPVLRDTPNLYEYWMLPVFLIVLAILAFVRVAYTRRLFRLFSSLVRIQILRQVMREELVFSHRVSVLLFINFALVSSLILFCAAKYYGWSIGHLSGWQLYVAIVCAVLGIYLLKLIGNSILRKILRDPGLIKEYLFEVFLVNKALSVILLPIAIAVAFSNIGKLNILLTVAGIIFLVFIVFRLIQGLIISLSYPISRVYIILYLCTLEILPFLIVWNLFQTRIM